MTEALYLKDSYLRECEATIASVKDGKYIVLDQTVFYPKGGGQPWDTGRIVKNGQVFNVIYDGLCIILSPKPTNSSKFFAFSFLCS